MKDKIRNKKKYQYIVIYGVLSYGLPMFIYMTFFADDTFKNDFSLLFLIIDLVVWLSAGALFGYMLYMLRKLFYMLRKLSGIKPKKNRESQLSSEKQVLKSETRLLSIVLNILLSPVLVLGPFVMVGLNLYNGINSDIIKWILLCFLSVFIAYHMNQNYHRVEIDGSGIKGQKFWSGKIIEYPISEIKQIKGAQIYFKNNDVITLFPLDMTNVAGFLRTLMEKYQSL